MYPIATHNIGLGPYIDDFSCLMKDLLMKGHFVKGFYALGKTIVFNVWLLSLLALNPWRDPQKWTP